MPIHQDRFKFGDIVTWRTEDHAARVNGRARFGDRITIKDTMEVKRDFRSVGHTQWVTILEDPKAGFESDGSCFSGAYFRHLSPEEKKHV